MRTVRGAGIGLNCSSLHLPISLALSRSLSLALSLPASLSYTGPAGHERACAGDFVAVAGKL
jgi:hypothetical protein